MFVEDVVNDLQLVRNTGIVSKKARAQGIFTRYVGRARLYWRSASKGFSIPV
jgi:hypothetical protein